MEQVGFKKRLYSTHTLYLLVLFIPAPQSTVVTSPNSKNHVVFFWRHSIFTKWYFEQLCVLTVQYCSIFLHIT
jgi:hypothetical protein